MHFASEALTPELVSPIKETERGNEREKIHVSRIRLASARFLEHPCRKKQLEPVILVGASLAGSAFF